MNGQESLGPEIGHVLLTLAVALVLGFLIGAVALRSLQREGLHWSWGALGTPVSYLLWFVDWRVGLVCSAATLTTMRRGAREHGEVIYHGGEEARRFRDAPGPVRFAWGQMKARRHRGERLKGSRLALGTRPDGGRCRVPFGITHGVHGLILGATGYGKTVTQAAIAQAYIRSGQAVIALDPKGDPALRESLRQAAAESGATFREWSPTGPTIYNPLARGGPTEIADKALAAHQWSEPHYEVATQRLLGHALTTMQEAGIWPPSLTTLVRHMELERLEDLASDLGGRTCERVCGYLDGLSTRAKADLGGGRDRLAVLAESELGPRLDPALGDGEPLDLRASLSAGDVLYFNLHSDRYPAASQLLAAALVIDLVGLTAELQGQGCGGLLLIEEFGALAAPQICRLFARARSAGLSLLLGAQSFADLRGAEQRSDTLTEQVIANVEFTVAHRIGDPDSAELLARMAGTAPAWSMSERVSGTARVESEERGTRTRTRELRVDPDEFQGLGVGEAVVINPSAARRAQVVRIWGPETAAEPSRARESERDACDRAAPSSAGFEGKMFSHISGAARVESPAPWRPAQENQADRSGNGSSLPASEAAPGGAPTPTEGLTTRRDSSSWLTRTLRAPSRPSPPALSPPLTGPRPPRSARPSTSPRAASHRRQIG
ncbi:MAG: helicase HerA-like domain-containing protein [Solirubrobacterales bacterium]